MRKQLNLFLITLLTCLVYGCGSGGGGQPTNPIQGGIQTLANQFFESYAATEHFTALSITAQCGNFGIPVTATVGKMGIDNNTTIRVNSIFQMGSITKSFISVVLLQLLEEKHDFSLDDTVGQWFKNQDGTPTYPLWQNVTIRQLFNMTSGIPSYTDNNAFWEYFYAHPYQYVSAEDLISYTSNQPLLFAPGTAYKYSDSAYILLGMLIPKISGKNYNGNDPVQFEINSRIISKLNLHNTYYVTNLPESAANINQLVHGYAYATEAMTDVIPNGTDTTYYSLSIANAAGAIISTTSDINTYIHALYTSGGLLSATQLANLESLISTQTGQPIGKPTADDRMGYGFGIFSLFFNNKVYFWYGGITTGFEDIYFVDPDTFNTAVISVNSTDGLILDKGGIAFYDVDNIMSYLSATCKQ